MHGNIGIQGLGIYLPPEVRRNDWWRPDVVERWTAERAAAPVPPPLTDLTEGAARVARGMAASAGDPFQGSVERHIMASSETVFDLEESAARAAIERAGVPLDAIDLVLTHTAVPDDLLTNSACHVHRRLGLSRQCMTLQIEASTYSFMMQLTIADSLIRSGRARCALLVQSSCASRLVDAGDPTAPLFGDGATAAVVGPVRDGHGLLADVHFTNGQWGRSLIASVRGGRWFDAGRATIHVGDPAEMRAVLLQTADTMKESVGAALKAAGLTTSDVDFLCVHQGTAWLREVIQDHLGLSHARSIDTFPRVGYLFAAILPATLAIAEQEGRLREGDIVVLTGGGAGITYGAAVLRWGGR